MSGKSERTKFFQLKKRAAMIEHVHKRLLRWSQQVIDSSHRGGGYGSNIIATMMAYGAVLVRGSGDSDLLLDSEGLETERIVRTMDSYHQQTIMVFYLRDDLTLDQQSKELDCSVRTLWRRVHACNVLLDELLKKRRQINTYNTYAQRQKVIHRTKV